MRRQLQIDRSCSFFELDKLPINVRGFIHSVLPPEMLHDTYHGPENAERSWVTI
jgi:hypothetical protein